VVFGVIFSLLQTVLATIPPFNKLNPTVLQGVALLLGVAAGAFVGWLVNKKFATVDGPRGGAEEGAELTNIDDLLYEAEARLGDAELEKDAKLGTLPAILVLGETASAKTHTMVHSGLEPELLTGQLYEANNILPTPVANVWFAKGTVFIEMAGKLLGDSESWKKLLKKLLPPKTAALLGTAEEAPRAVLVCVDAEALLSPSPDALAVTARKLRAQLGEISQMLGINLPVYVMFTRGDRLPFFAEYFSRLNEKEVHRILGVTLPIAGKRGVYAEEESSRIDQLFERLFRSLCHARPPFLSREKDPTQLAYMYEFPREFRKIKAPVVRFLVELGRPSQLNVSPFLRGFYFSGVRPVVVNEVAPAAPAPQESQAPGRIGATSMFRAQGAGQQGQRIVGTRKVPQWVFLGHFFNDLLLADTAARGASASSIRASMPRRILLATAAALCLFYTTALTVSFVRNRGLERDVRTAAQGIAAVDSAGMTTASLDSLKRLETLRQSLETLNRYDREGAPWSYRWGLYVGHTLRPEVRSIYFANFRQLLLAQTQSVIVDSLRSLPATPGPEYGPTYDSLKAYLITTSNHDKSTRAFLAPVLLNRWSANRNVDADRTNLAQKQFEFYADELKEANPFPSDNDAAAIGKARQYLNQFAAFERVYQAMLADATKAGPPINFNRQFPGSAETVLDGYEVPAAFTKPGWTFMRASLKNPEKYFAGEAWVLGEQSSAANLDRTKLAQQLADRYYADFVKEWRGYVKSASVLRYASLQDASKKLAVLSGNQSPLLGLFWLASQNTAVDVPDVANALQPVQAVVPPSSVDRYIAPPNQGYMNAMVTLQASVDAVAAQPSPNDAAAAQTLSNATAARVAAKQVAQTFRIDPEGHVDTMTEKLLEDPITNVEALLRNLGPAELNGKGKGLCSAYRAVWVKYPFNAAATVPASIAEVNGIFHKPDGALWKFYDENLQKLLPRQGSQYVAATAGGVTLTPAFVAFFNQAAAFSDFIYAGNTPDPHISYTLKPVPSEGIQTVGLRLDGQAFTYSGGDAAPKQFVWQAAGAHEARATVKFGGGPELAWSTNDGLWAVFQFFNKAETWRPSGNGNVLEWIIRIGKDPVTLPGGKALTVRFELDMGGAPQVFQKGFFNRMGCVADVAKP
jgi:type VI secretion system protein ImpL